MLPHFIPIVLLISCSPPVYLSIAYDSTWAAVASCAIRRSWTTVKLRCDVSSNAAITVTGCRWFRACRMRCFTDITIAQSVGRSRRAPTISALNSNEADSGVLRTAKHFGSCFKNLHRTEHSLQSLSILRRYTVQQTFVRVWDTA
jgi:hypothetical protein